MSEQSGLSGYWTGWYDYGDGRGRTPFTASISDTSGGLDGATLEVTERGAELQATIEGDHDGHFVTFTKLYNSTPDGHYDHPIEYAGQILNKGREVRGKWVIEFEESFLGTAMSYVGDFAMQRVSRGIAVSAEEKQSLEARR